MKKKRKTALGDSVICRCVLCGFMVFMLVGCGSETAGTIENAVESRTAETEMTMAEMETVETVTTADKAIIMETDTLPEPEAEVETVPEEEPEAESDSEPTQNPDVTAPIIEGVRNLTVEQGKSISYKKGVSVTDDLDSEVTLEVDSSQVNLNVPGVYNVFYRAADQAGNQAEAVCTVTVTEPVPITEGAIYALADQLLTELITDDMTQYEKAETLWWWCHDNITYRYSSDERDILSGAYRGLHDRSGDCYIYYATYEVLLTRCGIDNMCVTRVGGSSSHWWNLVNVGYGWYHCDCSPRSVKANFFICFMQTDEQIAAYSDYYYTLFPDKPNYYGFDSSIYPERATTILVENTYPQ